MGLLGCPPPRATATGKAATPIKSAVWLISKVWHATVFVLVCGGGFCRRRLGVAHYGCEPSRPYEPCYILDYIVQLSSHCTHRLVQCTRIWMSHQISGSCCHGSTGVGRLSCIHSYSLAFFHTRNNIKVLRSTVSASLQVGEHIRDLICWVITISSVRSDKNHLRGHKYTVS
jgi:hypothetical protein